MPCTLRQSRNLSSRSTSSRASDVIAPLQHTTHLPKGFLLPSCMHAISASPPILPHQTLPTPASVNRMQTRHKHAQKQGDSSYIFLLFGFLILVVWDLVGRAEELLRLLRFMTVLLCLRESCSSKALLSIHQTCIAKTTRVRSSIRGINMDNVLLSLHKNNTCLPPIKAHHPSSPSSLNLTLPFPSPNMHAHAITTHKMMKSLTHPVSYFSFSFLS